MVTHSPAISVSGYIFSARDLETSRPSILVKFPMTVAAASEKEAVSERTVAAEAIPFVKLLPPSPLVATPPIPMVESMVKK